MLRAIVIATLLGSVGTLPSPATAMSGNDLYRYCIGEPAEPVAQIGCIAFIGGFIEGLGIGQEMQRTGKPICAPEGLNAGQARLMIEKRMREHPEFLHFKANEIAGAALLAAFPCPKR